MLYIDTLRI